MTRTTYSSQWFLEIFLDSSTVRWCSGFVDTAFDGETYTALGDRWTPPARVRRRSALNSQALNLTFDSSRQTDNTDPIGALLDENWRRRQVRLRQVIMSAGETPDQGDTIVDERGRIRNVEDTLQVGKSAILEMEIESGVLAYLERRMQTRSPENQRAVFPDDAGFDSALVLNMANLVWGTSRISLTAGMSSNTVGTTAFGARSGSENADTEDPPAREMAIGVFATEGTFVQSNTYGANSKGNTIFQRVVAIADHKIEAIDQVWFNGELAYYSFEDGALQHGVRTGLNRISNFVNPKPGSDDINAWITFYDGRPDQVTSSPYFPEDEWTADNDRVLKGVAYAIIEVFDYDYNAEPPSVRFVGRGAPLYDRRRDSTAGGSGSHRWDDPDTWEYSTNPMVAIDHYRAGRRIMAGSSAMWFGVGEQVDALPYAEFEDLANHCEESVTLSDGGTQLRYEAGGFISAANDHKKNFEILASAMAAKVIDQGGRISVRPVRSSSSVLTITDGDLVQGTKTVASPGGNIDDLANTIEGRFNDENNYWLRNDYPRVSDDTYIAEDGEDLIVTRDFDLEWNAERAQRLAKLELQRSRRIFTIEETILVSKARRSDGTPLQPGDWFTRQSDLRGFPGGKLFELSEIDRNVDGTATIAAFEVDPNDDAWVASEARDLSLPIIPTTDTLETDVPSPTLTAFSQVSGGVTVPAVFVDFPDAVGLAITTNDFIEIELQVVGVANTTKTEIVRGDIDGVTFSGLAPGTSYSFRFRGRSGKFVSDWSSAQTVTTTGDYIAGSAATADIATSIVGQGPFATSPLSEEEVVRSGAQGEALNQNPRFNDPRSPATGVPSEWTDWVHGSLLTRIVKPGNGYAAKGAANAAGFGNLGVSQFIPSTNPSGKYKMRLKARRTGGTYHGAGMLVQWFDSSGGYLSAVTLACATTKTVAGIGPGAYHDGLTTWDQIVDAPASATSARLFCMWSWAAMPGYTATDSLRYEGEIHECSLIPVSDTERITETQEEGANVTADHTAGAVLNQGLFATATPYSQSSDPGAVPDGSIWHNTGNDEVNLRLSGAWVRIANYSVGGSGLNAIKDQDAYGFRFGAGTATSNSVTVSASGGTGPFTFDWSMPTGPQISASSLTDASVTFSATLAAGETKIVNATCTITDTATGLKASIGVFVQLTAS